MTDLRCWLSGWLHHFQGSAAPSGQRAYSHASSQLSSSGGQAGVLRPCHGLSGLGKKSCSPVSIFLCWVVDGALLLAEVSHCILMHLACEVCSSALTWQYAT